jgi:MoxR-like ATPase
MTQKKLQALRSELNQMFFERSQVIDGLLATMLHGSNAVLFGPPGTAKSDLVQAICNTITGARYFNRLLFKTMPPEELLGQPSLKELRDNDILVRNTTDRLPEAEVAFLDEIFKCSPATLNSLLRIANEREFDNPRPKKVPLIFLVGASNEVPTEPEMLAFLDRFIYKAWVQPLRREKSRRDLIAMADTKKRSKITVTFTMQELKALQDEAQKIPLHSLLVSQILILCEEFAKKNLYMSDRKLVKIIELLKCYAYVQGDAEAMPDHLHELIPCCVSNTEGDIREARAVIKEKCPTLHGMASEWLDTARKIAVETTEQASSFMRSDRTDQSRIRLQRAIDSATKNVGDIKSQLETAVVEWKDRSARVQKIATSIDDILTEIAGHRELIYI